MNDKFYEIFSANALAEYWKDVDAHMADATIGTKYFPNKRIQGLDIKWIKGKNSLPVVLQPSAYDTKASLRDRIGVSAVETELPFFREAMRIGEKDRQEIGNFLAKGFDFAQAAITRIYDDVKALVDGAEVQAERMRMSLLVNGQISVTASAGSGRTAAYSYNYGDSNWETSNVSELTSTAKWNAANKSTSTPIQDIEQIVNAAAEKGVVITELLMNTTTLNGLLASESIAKAMNPVGASNLIVTKSQAKAFVESMTGVTITTYDKSFIDEENTTKKFYPDNYVTFLPSGALGNTYYGTTPEEYDLMNGNTDAQTSIVGGGIAVTTIKEAHPVNVQTIVSAQMLPSFEQIDSVYVLKVA